MKYNSAIYSEYTAFVKGQPAYIVGGYYRDQFEKILIANSEKWARTIIQEQGTITKTYMYIKKGVMKNE